MTPEEKREYNKQYRADGYGRNADARYRLRNKDKLREYMRAYMKRRREAVRAERPTSY